MKQLLTTLSVRWLSNQLRKDEGLYLSWKSAIAMSFQDNYHQAKDKKDIYKIANESADYFLQLLIQ